MANDPKNLISKLSTDLKAIESNKKLSTLEIAELALIHVAGHLLKLKVGLKKIPLKKINDQILFFKKIQPRYFSALLYYQFIAVMERKNPGGSHSQQVLYYHRALKQVNNYLDQRQFFVTYKRLKCRYLDQVLFSLPPDDLAVYPDNGDFHYTEYFNFFSYSLAKINAYERLRQFLLWAAESGIAIFDTKWGKTSSKNIGTFHPAKAPKAYLRERNEILRKMEWLALKTETGTNFFYSTLKSAISRKKSRSIILKSLTTAGLKK